MTDVDAADEQPVRWQDAALEAYLDLFRPHLEPRSEPQVFWGTPFPPHWPARPLTERSDGSTRHQEFRKYPE